MDDYGINDAIEDLNALDIEPMDAEQRAGCIARIRALVLELGRDADEIAEASVLIGDDR